MDPVLDPEIGRRSVENAARARVRHALPLARRLHRLRAEGRARATARAYVSGPYWLEDPLEARADRRHDGPVDVAVVGGASRAARARACSPRPGSACGCTRRVRSPAERAAGTVGSHCEEALRRTTWRRVDRPRARRRLLAFDRAGARPDGGVGRRRIPAHRQPATRGRRGGGGAAAPRVRADATRTASTSSGATSSTRPFGRCSPPPCSIPPDAALQPARWTRRLARARGAGRRRHPRGEPRRVRRRARKPSRSSSRPTATRAACSAHSRA